jgi:hypothetical protein
MNNFAYPNRLIKVLDGTGSAIDQPFKCSDIDLSTEEIYSWLQNSPDQ